VERLAPEAAYFLPSEDGHRSCVIVFDMSDPAQVPVIVEPLFLALRARVTLDPCMTLQDVQEGLAEAFSEAARTPS
jgi:hypothetical protein